jgi:SAM-dependent methyltransferase
MLSTRLLNRWQLAQSAAKSTRRSIRGALALSLQSAPPQERLCRVTVNERTSLHIPIWHQGITRPGQCPICAHQGEIPLLLSVKSTALADTQVTFASCPACGTLFQLGFEAPRYESNHVLPIALKFYVEQGAGLDTLVMPSFIAREHAAGRYLEIGCGFGFGLDFARCAFGWDVRGIDPSPIAQEGRRLLQVNIDSRYLEASDGGNGNYDAIGAVEVLEHIPQPHEFLKILRSQLNPAGVVVITTPDAEYVESGCDKPGLLNALTPGYHAFLLSRKSLELALRKVGFTEMQIVVRGATLLAVAGEGAAAINLDEVFDAAIYRQYLERRLETVDPSSILGIGFGYRLFKHLINTNSLSAAEPIQLRLASTLRERDGIDILDPHRLLGEFARSWKFEDYIERLPACLVGLLYFSGILRLNGANDPQGAAAYFYATYVFAGIFRNAMKEFGIDDGETGDLENQARKHLQIALDR